MTERGSRKIISQFVIKKNVSSDVYFNIMILPKRNVCLFFIKVFLNETIHNARNSHTLYCHETGFFFFLIRSVSVYISSCELNLFLSGSYQN